VPGHARVGGADDAEIVAVVRDLPEHEADVATAKRRIHVLHNPKVLLCAHIVLLICAGDLPAAPSA